MVFTVTRRLEHTTLLEMLLHTADKSFQGTDEGFDHAANSKSVSGLTSMIPDFQAYRIAIYQKFERMSKVASTTLLGWHRDLFRFYWRQKSKNKQKVSLETIQIIHKMANENPLWGAERIRGELLKLGIKACKRTIQKYMPKAKKSPSSSQTWATFVRNHSRDIWACDFTVVNDWLFRTWHIFVLIELKTRRIFHVAVTTSPTDEWTAQQLREATP